MARKEHIDILKQGVNVWNKWREEHPTVIPNLRKAKLFQAKLEHINLARAFLQDAELHGAYLRDADLSDANLEGANLSDVTFVEAVLRRANLHGAQLLYSYFNGAELEDANLERSDLTGAILIDSNVRNAKFNRAQMWLTKFSNMNLGNALGLDDVVHSGPSTIGLDTLYKSGGRIPEAFLRGCGVPDDFITFIPSHFGLQEAIQFYSCFISYSTKDDHFAERLHSRLRDAHLRVWFAPEDIKGGQKLHEQIERAIEVYDRLLLVLSESSMQSEWVITEIRNARKLEIEEKRRKIFPIRLVDFDIIRKWKCFDAETGKDLAVEVREYFIPDFSNWKDHDCFEAAFSKLLRDLKAQEVGLSRD